MSKLNIEEILGSFKGLELEDVLKGQVEVYENLVKQEKDLKASKDKIKTIIIDALNGMNADTFETSDRIITQYTIRGQKYNKAKCFDDLFNKDKIPSHYLNKHTNKTISQRLVLKITEK